MRAMPPVLRDLTLLLVTFAAATALAAALGAANLGTAASFGQIAFAGALVYVLLRR
jgi:ABC-type methionine transport system permease subunit